MLLLNNVIDRGFLIIGLLLTVLIYYGMLQAFFGTPVDGELPNVTGQAVIFGASTVIVMIYMYIQKRIHKEVFLEIK